MNYRCKRKREILYDELGIKGAAIKFFHVFFSLFINFRGKVNAFARQSVKIRIIFGVWFESENLIKSKPT